MEHRFQVVGTIFGLLLLSQGALAQQAARPPISPLGSPSGLATRQYYKTERVSSEDREGNADMRVIGPGQTLEMADLKGPGEITHLWTTINTADPDHLRNIVFRIYWDGNDYPSVESPVGDFFGLGHAKYYMFDNPVQAIGTDKGMNCFWPMPFKKSARVTATNESQTTVGAYYYYVDYRTFDKLPEDSLYFHAQYRQAFPNQDGKNYEIMETTGTGHFAGVSLSIHTQTNGWWGEGDDIFTIDGESRPSLWGTGSEDYFCGAWCYGKTFYNNYFGMPLRERPDQGLDNYWNVYRHHLESPITFTKSIKAEIEHGYDGVSNTRKPRNNDYSSCAYYYVDTPQRLAGPLPAAADRLPHFRPMPQPEGVIEAQYMKLDAPESAKVDHQDIGRDARKDGDWLNNDQLFVRGMKPGETATLTFTTTATLSGPAALFVTRANDYGIVEVSLDGKVLGSFDGYNPDIDRAMVDLGEMKLDQGTHKLTVRVKGKNPESRSEVWGIDMIKVGGADNYPEAKAKTLEFKK